MQYEQTRDKLLGLGIDIPYNDILRLYTLYPENEVEVIAHAADYTFDNKLINWYSGKTKLSNMDEFRSAALHFQEYGRYTNSVPSRHPKSQWKLFWDEQARRCVYGYHIGRDWIPGYYYFYLNFSPIELIEEHIEDGEKYITRKMEFPEVWDGDYYAFHYLEEARRLGKHGLILKKRGAGFSWKFASMMNRNYFLIPGSRSQVYADDTNYLIKDGVLAPKAWSILAFVDSHTAWTKKRLKDTELHKMSGFKAKLPDGTLSELGWKSEIIGNTIKDDVHKVRGKRSMLIGFEEFGSQNKGKQAWEVTNPSVEQGTGKRKKVFGLKVGWGTGGEEGSTFEAMKTMIYKPNGFGILDVPNLWDANSDGQRVGYFFPEYVNMEGHYDKDGNSNMKSAKIDIMEERDNLVKGGIDGFQMALKKAEKPMTIQEAILRTDGSPFPITDLRERLAKLETDTKLRNARNIGELSLTDEGTVRFVHDIAGQLKPIDTVETSGVKEKGAVVIYEHPFRREQDAAIPSGRYCLATDPVDFDSAEVGTKHSLACTYVIDAFTRKIVAEYLSRPERTEEFYENTRRLAIYYNGKVMYENNLKGIYTYFRNKNSEELLADNPRSLSDKLELKPSNDRKKGFTSTPKIKNYGLSRINDWLISATYNNPEMMILHTIRSIGLLEELIAWHKDGNFDRVSALIAGMIYLDEMNVVVESGQKVASSILQSKYFTRITQSPYYSHATL